MTVNFYYAPAYRHLNRHYDVRWILELITTLKVVIQEFLNLQYVVHISTNKIYLYINLYISVCVCAPLTIVFNDSIL